MTLRTRRGRQSGRLNSVTLGLILTAAAGIYGGAKFGPPYIRNYQLENAFDDEARRAHLVTDDEGKSGTEKDGSVSDTGRKPAISAWHSPVFCFDCPMAETRNQSTPSTLKK